MATTRNHFQYIMIRDTTKKSDDDEFPSSLNIDLNNQSEEVTVAYIERYKKEEAWFSTELKVCFITCKKNSNNKFNITSNTG